MCCDERFERASFPKSIFLPHRSIGRAHLKKKLHTGSRAGLLEAKEGFHRMVEAMGWENILLVLFLASRFPNHNNNHHHHKIYCGSCAFAPTTTTITALSESTVLLRAALSCCVQCTLFVPIFSRGTYAFYDDQPLMRCSEGSCLCFLLPQDTRPQTL